MENLEFVIANEPDLYPMDTEIYLYNDKVYLQSKKELFGSPITYYALEGDKAVAKIHFFMVRQNNGELEAVSIPASPFGSIEYNKNISATALTAFVHYFKSNLLARQVKCILIKDCIAAYRQENNMMPELMEETGFRARDQIINHHIFVDRESMVSKLGRGKLSRISHCQEEGFKVQQKPVSDIEEIYEFLYQCYQSKERRLSLSFSQLEEQALRNPHSYLLFAVYDQQKIIAASVAVKVNPSILYTFYYAGLSEYNHWSPTTFLLYSIYQHCWEKKISVMDMGTSLSASVAHFKAHMGGVPSFKFTYQYCK